MSRFHVIFGIVLLVTPYFPLYTSASAAAASSAAEYDRKSTHVQSTAHTPDDSEVIECDTSKKLLTTPPSEQELKKSYVAAEQALNGTDALIALCQPYLNHNPDIFAGTVFQKFLELCKEKNGQTYWYAVLDDKVQLHDYILQTARAGLAEELPSVCTAARNPIFWCCLGIASSYAAYPYNPNGFNLIQEAHRRGIPLNSYQFMHAYREVAYETIEQAYKNYWDARGNLPKLKTGVLESTATLPELAQIITDYCSPQFGQTTTKYFALPTKKRHHNDLYCRASLLYDLAKLRDVPATSVDLYCNLIETIHPIDLQSHTISAIYLAYNRVRHLPDRAFAGLATLEILHLSNNQIAHLTRAMFAGCNKLRELRLVDNPIATVEAGTFSQLPRLHAIHMQNNKLTVLPPDFAEMANRLEVLNALSALDLAGNPLLTDPTENEKYEILKKQIKENVRQRKQDLLGVARSYALAAPVPGDSDSAGIG